MESSIGRTNLNKLQQRYLSNIDKQVDYQIFYLLLYVQKLVISLLEKRWNYISKWFNKFRVTQNLSSKTKQKSPRNKVQFHQ